MKQCSRHILQNGQRMHLYAEENPMNRRVQRERISTVVMSCPNGLHNIQCTKKYRKCPKSKFKMDLGTAIMMHSPTLVTGLRIQRRLFTVPSLFHSLVSPSVHYYSHVNSHLPKSLLIMYDLLRLWLFPTKAFNYSFSKWSI